MRAIASAANAAAALFRAPGRSLASNTPPQSAAAEVPDVKQLLRGPARLGVAIVVVFFVMLGGWAALAPLSSGAVAPGMVSPDSNRKVIQHLEGGIIRTVHVREGQQVAAGDPLVTLEATRAEATFSAREEQWLRLLATRARLEAQQVDADALVLPAELQGIRDPEILEFILTQEGLLTIRQTTIEQEEAIYERQIEQLLSEISSIEAESAGMTQQVALTDKELVAKQQLLDEQLVAQSSVLELQREKARLESLLASNVGRVARANQSIEATRLSLLQARQKYRDEVAQESVQVNNELAQLNEDMVSSGDVLRRTEIVSPVDGVVLNLRSQTPGGVIRPGEPIMDVVPLDDDLIIVARLQPRDIDVVRVGLPSQVTLLPFATRNALPLQGEVVQVAADSILDESTRQYYFEVRVKVATEELAKNPGFYLSPGMPADVTIVTGERTMLQYLVDPFVRSIRTAFVND